MKKAIFVTGFFLSSFLLLYVNVKAQSNKPYTDGAVWIIDFIQTNPGMEQTYLNDLSTHWVKISEAAKSQGLITNYKVLTASPSAKTDWDLMLMIEVKNYAALDSIENKMDALAKKLFGTEETQHQSALSRNEMRDLLGSKLARELIFKK